VGRLLDDGIYLCSISTMYRLLTVAGENRERRRQRTHPAKKKPELIATGPNSRQRPRRQPEPIPPPAPHPTPPEFPTEAWINDPSREALIQNK
jgi:hypothetical protein